MIELSDAERARWNKKIQETLDLTQASAVGDMTVEQLIALMQGK